MYQQFEIKKLARLYKLSEPESKKESMMPFFSENSPNVPSQVSAWQLIKRVEGGVFCQINLSYFSSQIRDNLATFFCKN
jgi:hypothetical protein